MFARLLAAGLIALAAPYAAAQRYPSKPVRIIVPFAPGGGSDFTARLMAQKLTERYGQSFIVENRAGAGGNLGAELALKAPPDGYTLLLISASHGQPERVQALVRSDQGHRAGHPDLGRAVRGGGASLRAGEDARRVRELRARSRKLAYGSSGNGSVMHVSTAYFLDSAKIKVLHVPYKGTGPALQDTLGGQVQLIFGAVPTTLPHVESRQAARPCRDDAEAHRRGAGASDHRRVGVSGV